MALQREPIKTMRAIILIFACLCLALAACAGARPCREPFRDQLRQAVLDDPDLVLDVLRDRDIEVYEIATQGAAHKRERQAAQRLSDELAHPLAPVVDPARPMRGPADAPVTIVEYSDFLCSWCARAAATMDELLQRRPGQLRLVYKHLAHDQASILAALYFEALGEQDPALAWGLHDMLFAGQDLYREQGEAYLRAVAVELGADMARLDADLLRDDLRSRLAADEAEAEAFGLSGTPMFVVGGVSVRGAVPLEEFDQVIRLLLERATAR